MKHGTCMHFNGVQNELCKRGVSYEVMWPSGPKPCIKLMHKSARGGTYLRPGEIPAETTPFPGADRAKPCPFYEEPTEEQVQADRVETEAALERHMCPVCKGRLHLSQSAYNGHVHGACETDGCVRWFE